MSEDDRPKLLWHSNAPWTKTGYGAQTALFAPHLAERYELRISSFYGLEGNILPWNGIPVLPGIAGTYGNETIGAHAGMIFGDDSRSGLVMTLMDVWVLDPQILSQFNVCSWVPIDHEPAPQPVLEFLVAADVIPLAMSRFGERQLREAGLDPLYCPHAVDTKLYRPIEGAREKAGIPEDVFVVGMVAANKGNPSRKCFQEAFEAFQLLHDRHPEVKLYLHTELTGRFEGVNLRRLAQAIGIPESALVACDQYRAMHFPYDDEAMAAVYSALDVLLMPSAGEGFGVPAIEAQACGTPVIASDFSAQPELVGSGWLVEGTRRYTPIGSWQFRPSVADIYDALRQAYALHRDGNDEHSAKAVEFARTYDIRHVMAEQMLPAIEEAWERFGAREPVELAAA